MSQELKNESNIVKILPLKGMSGKLMTLRVTIPKQIAASNGFIGGRKAVWVSNPNGKGVLLIPLED